MNRSPSPFLRWPPAPRSPSSSKAPVMSEPGITSPVGWNCTISMSRRDRPARYASAMPSAALSAEHAITRYIVGPPPVARSVTRAASAMKRPVRMSRTSAPAARRRVEQVRLEGVGLGEDRVVAALHHAGAAGAPEEPLDDDRDAELRRRVGGVKRGAEARAARAEDQDVGLGGVDQPERSAWSRARPIGPVHSLVLKALPTSVPSRPTTNTVGVPVTR